MQRKYNGIVIHKRHDAHGVIEVVEDCFHRSLHFGTPPRQSSMRLDDPVGLVLSYTRAMLCPLLFRSPPTRVLLIGLGGASLARFLLHHFPECHVTAVELRQTVIDIAHTYFHLPHDEHRLTLHADDGAAFLRKALPGQYDLILVDAFDHAGMSSSVDGLNFFAACRASLRDEGVMAMNLWLEEKKSLRASFDALATCFDRQILRLPVPGKGNLIVLAFANRFHRRELRSARERLQPLEQRFSIEFAVFLRELRRANPILPFTAF